MAEKKNPSKRKSKASTSKPKTTLKTLLAKLLRFAVGIGIPIQLVLPYFLFPPVLEFYQEHLTYPIAPLAILITMIAYNVLDHSRTHPPKDKRGKPRRDPLPPSKALGQVLKDSTDIIGNLDTPVWRVVYLLGFAAGVVLPIMYPVTVDTFNDLEGNIRLLILSAGVPVFLVIIMLGRISSIMRQRLGWIEEIYAIARDCFDYKPLPQRGQVSKRQRITATPHLAIDVRKWRTLTTGDTFFVWVPESLSAGSVDTWDEFGLNLEEKMPREEEWRIRTKGQRGRGAIVGPANYPRSILWDGEYDTDPLTFSLGDDLETGERYKITFNDASPHAAISGGTSSGKTSGAEIIAAEALVKPMPWDSSLYCQVHIVDPKGPFAQRWVGRPNVIVSNGQQDSATEPYVYNEDGDEVCEKTGVMVMAEHIEFIEEEHKRRANVLSRSPDAATWMDLSDDVKREEKFFPIFVILDEFLDHTSGQRGKGIRVEMENEAREFIVSMTDWQLRKARNVGIHILMIAQRANMKLIGDTMMTNMPIRLVTGQIDKPQLTSMFAIPATDVPRLPSTYHDPVKGRTKTIPGRARILNALGQSISKIQIMWFGGSTNSGTLDKWLPRGEKPLNGDFSLPEGTRPRMKADFDAEGNLIEAEATTEGDKTEPETVDEPTEAATEAPPESLEPEELDEDEEPAPEQAPTRQKPEPEPEDEEEPGIFTPAPSATSCAICPSESSWSCPECSTRYCTDHGGRTRNPDIDSKSRFICSNCADKSPLVAVGLATLLPDVITKVRRLRLPHDYAVEEDDSGPYGVLRVREAEDGKKIVEVRSRAKEGSPDGGFAYTARSSSGTVEGLAKTEERIDMAIKTHVRKQREKAGETP